MKTTSGSWLRVLGATMLLSLTSCGGEQRSVLFVPSSLGVQGTDPNLPPAILSIDFLGVVKVDNLVVMNRHPNVRLSLLACGEQYDTRTVRWKPAVGWAEDRFVIPAGCSRGGDAVLAILNEESGNYVAIKKLTLGDLMRNEPVELKGVGGWILLNVRAYELPRADEPRHLSIVVPAYRPIEDLAIAAGKQTGERLPVEGWEPIPVAEGDLVKVHIDGQICDDDKCFGPEGRPGWFSSSYRLRVRVGSDEERDVGSDSSFVVRHTGDLEMFVDDAGPRLSGAFTAEVHVNPAGSRNVQVGATTPPRRTNRD